MRPQASIDIPALTVHSNNPPGIGDGASTRRFFKHGHRYSPYLGTGKKRLQFPTEPCLPGAIYPSVTHQLLLIKSYHPVAYQRFLGADADPSITYQAFHSSMPEPSITYQILPTGHNLTFNHLPALVSASFFILQLPTTTCTQTNHLPPTTYQILLSGKTLPQMIS